VIKEAIHKGIKDPKVLEQIDAIPDCFIGTDVELCAGKAKRKRSAYQEFVSVCMKAGGAEGAAELMKSCAIKWKAEKARLAGLGG
jgi:hypothetical protein